MAYTYQYFNPATDAAALISGILTGRQAREDFDYNRRRQEALDELNKRKTEADIKKTEAETGGVRAATDRTRAETNRILTLLGPESDQIKANIEGIYSGARLSDAKAIETMALIDARIAHLEALTARMWSSETLDRAAARESAERLALLRAQAERIVGLLPYEQQNLVARTRQTQVAADDVEATRPTRIGAAEAGIQEALARSALTGEQTTDMAATRPARIGGLEAGTALTGEQTTDLAETRDARIGAIMAGAGASLGSADVSAAQAARTRALTPGEVLQQGAALEQTEAATGAIIGGEARENAILPERMRLTGAQARAAEAGAAHTRATTPGQVAVLGGQAGLLEAQTAEQLSATGRAETRLEQELKNMAASAGLTEAQTLQVQQAIVRLADADAAAAAAAVDPANIRMAQEDRELEVRAAIADIELTQAQRDQVAADGAKILTDTTIASAQEERTAAREPTVVRQLEADVEAAEGAEFRARERHPLEMESIEVENAAKRAGINLTTAQGALALERMNDIRNSFGIRMEGILSDAGLDRAQIAAVQADAAVKAFELTRMQEDKPLDRLTKIAQIQKTFEDAGVSAAQANRLAVEAATAADANRRSQEMHPLEQANLEAQTEAVTAGTLLTQARTTTEDEMRDPAVQGARLGAVLTGEQTETERALRPGRVGQLETGNLLTESRIGLTGEQTETERALRPGRVGQLETGNLSTESRIGLTAEQTETERALRPGRVRQLETGSLLSEARIRQVDAAIAREQEEDRVNAQFVQAADEVTNVIMNGTPEQAYEVGAEMLKMGPQAVNEFRDNPDMNANLWVRAFMYNKAAAEAGPQQISAEQTARMQAEQQAAEQAIPRNTSTWHDFVGRNTAENLKDYQRGATTPADAKSMLADKAMERLGKVASMDGEAFLQLVADDPNRPEELNMMQVMLNTDAVSKGVPPPYEAEEGIIEGTGPYALLVQNDYNAQIAANAWQALELTAIMNTFQGEIGWLVTEAVDRSISMYGTPNAMGQGVGPNAGAPAAGGSPAAGGASPEIGSFVQGLANPGGVDPAAAGADTEPSVWDAFTRLPRAIGGLLTGGGGEQQAPAPAP